MCIALGVDECAERSRLKALLYPFRARLPSWAVHMWVYDNAIYQGDTVCISSHMTAESGLNLVVAHGVLDRIYMTGNAPVR